MEAQFQRTMRMVKRLEDVDAAVPYLDCVFTLRELEEMLDERCLPTMVKILERRQPVKYARWGRMRGVRGIGPPLAGLQCSAIEVIKAFGSLAYVPLFRKVENGEWDRDVRMHAKRAILELEAKIPRAEAVVGSLVRELIEDSPSKERRSQIFRELKSVYRFWAIPAVLEYLGEEHPLSVRERAVEALAVVGCHRATVPLVELLWDEEESIRADAATILGWRIYGAALPALRNSRTDPSEKVRKAARLAIQQHRRPRSPLDL